MAVIFSSIPGPLPYLPIHPLPINNTYPVLRRATLSQTPLALTLHIVRLICANPRLLAPAARAHLPGAPAVPEAAVSAADHQRARDLDPADDERVRCAVPRHEHLRDPRSLALRRRQAAALRQVLGRALHDDPGRAARRLVNGVVRDLNYEYVTFGVGFFFVSFVIIVAIVILNVVVAMLLDEFVESVQVQQDPSYSDGRRPCCDASADVAIRVLNGYGAGAIQSVLLYAAESVEKVVRM
eukprot:602109-Rhodomonas_salina.1